MPWSDLRALAHMLGDDDAFLARYCSAVTLNRLGSADVGLVREVLRRIAEALPDAAHTTPTWNGGPQCIVAIGQPTFRPNGHAGVTTVIGQPYIGLCWDKDRKELFLWADPDSKAESKSDDWHGWRLAEEGAGGTRLRFGEPLTREEDPLDPLATGQPLGLILEALRNQMSLRDQMSPATKPSDVEEAIEQARVDIDELDGLQECGDGSRDFLDVMYPRLAARLSGKPQDEDMALGGSGGSSGRTRAETPSSGAFNLQMLDGSSSGTARLPDHRFPLCDVVAITHTQAPGRCGVPFLNLRFSAAKYYPHEQLRGPGIYGLFFAPPDDARHLVYVGSYRGRKGEPFGGNVAEDRWCTHAASLTMRGDRISVARRTTAWAKELGSGDPFSGLTAKPCLLVDAGCSAGLNRVRFAQRHWERFGTATCHDLCHLFEFVYLRLAPRTVGPATTSGPDGQEGNCVAAHGRSDLSRSILDAEKEVIRELRPTCNYQVREGSAREDVRPDDFVRVVREVLG